MKRSTLLAALAGLALLLGSACRAPEEPSAYASGEVYLEETSEGSALAEISAAQDLLKAGQVDEAAARLIQLQLQGAEFNREEASAVHYWGHP